MRDKKQQSICVLFLAFMSGCSGGGADVLASKLESALKNGDANAEAALLETKGVPADAQFSFRDLIDECFEKLHCVVSIAPLSKEFSERMAKQKESENVELRVAPEGLVRIKGDAAREHMTVELPFAKVNGDYKIIAATFTPAKVAELKNQSAQSIADALLNELAAAGLGDPPDKDWKAHARPLAAGGEAAGAYIVSRDHALAEAARAKNPDAAVTVLGSRGTVLYGEKDFEGKPVPTIHRQLKLWADSVRFKDEVNVLGGYTLNDVYALIYDGRDGAGWTVKGCRVGKFKDGQWEPIAVKEIAIPPE